jgi:uncharacterized protein (DUF1810 family)
MDHDLDRFLSAQAPVYERVLGELRRGHKDSHWIWFIFPQVEGLGSSATSMRYAIRSLEEARAYLAHPLLGARLRECARLVLDADATSAEAMLGAVDARKLRSSMTLFHRADPAEPVFRAVLDRWFRGGVDEATDLRLARR